MVISDFARRTPLNKKQMKDLGLKIAREWPADNFVERYILSLKLEKKDRKKLVKKDPSFVELCFHLFGDREFGELYVKEYGQSEDRHHTAYFISVELGMPIKRENTNRDFGPNSYSGSASSKEVLDAIRYDQERLNASLRTNECRVDRSGRSEDY